MNPRALSIIANVALTVLVLQANVLAQEETRDAVSTADPAQEGFSAQRLGEMEKAIQNGDFKQITSVLIARQGRVIYEHYFDKDGVEGGHTKLKTKDVAQTRCPSLSQRGIAACPRNRVFESSNLSAGTRFFLIGSDYRSDDVEFE
jgi:hypothetical protein